MNFRNLPLLALLLATAPLHAQLGVTPAQYYYNLQSSYNARFYTPYQNGFGNGVGYGGVAPVVNPGYTLNPYTPAAGATLNPYTAGAGVDPYASSFLPYSNPYLGAGSYLSGSADLTRAYGTVMNDAERARILREQALQARIDTKKKQFEFAMWVRANTPTYAEEQNKIARSTLMRIQTNSSPTEIVSGKALNVLLDDLRKFTSKKVAMEPIQLTEEILRQINVTKSSGSLGVLRNPTKFSFPQSLNDLLGTEKQRAMNAKIQQIMQDAVNGKIDNILLGGVETETKLLRESLIKKMNELPTMQYLDARRFLNDFDEALVAVRRGEVQTQNSWQAFVTGGKSIQDLTEYMVSNGLKFGPATAFDEGSYRALHSAMVAFDVTLNAQLTMVDRKDQ